MNAIGIDFSFDVPVLWSDIQVDFVIRRLTDGPYFDSGFEHTGIPPHNMRKFLVGGYGALYPRSNMLDQVAAMVAAYRRYDGEWDLPFFVDCEAIGTNCSPLVRWQRIDDCCSGVEDGIGKRVGIYTRKDWWEKYTKSPHVLGWITQRPLWLALAANMRRDACPRDWYSYAIWQKLFNARAQGVGSCVDINEYPGTVEDLRRWAMLEKLIAHG